MTDDDRKTLARLAHEAMATALQNGDPVGAIDALRFHDLISRCANGKVTERKPRKKKAGG